MAAIGNRRAADAPRHRGNAAISRIHRLGAAAGELQLRALVGTTVEIHATATKPLASAAVQLSTDESVPATVSADGYEFSIPADSAHGLP